MSLGDLSVSLRLNTSDFQAGLNRAKGGLYKFYQESVRINQSIELGKNIYSGIATAVAEGVKAVEEGAKSLDVKEVFSNLATSMGKDANTMLAELKLASNGYLSEVKAMSLSTQSMMSGMDFGDVKVTMEYLQKYAKATGRDFDQLTQTIMTGLARGSTLMLDDAGIIIDAQSVINQKTQEYGRDLTEVEKKQVLVSAAIEQMKAKMGALNTEQTTAYDGIQRLKAGWEDFKAAMSRWALRAVAIGKIALAGWQAIGIELKALWYKLAFDVTHVFDYMKQGILMSLASLSNKMSVILFDMKAKAPELMQRMLSDMLSTTISMTNTLTQKAADTNGKIIEAQNKELKPLLDETDARLKAIAENNKLWWELATGTYNAGGSSGGSVDFDLSGTSGGGTDKEDDKAAKELESRLERIKDSIKDVKLDLKNLGQDDYTQEMNNINAQYESMLEGFEGNTAVKAQADAWKEIATALANARKEMADTQVGFNNFNRNLEAKAGMVKAVFDAMGDDLASGINDAITSGKLNVGDLLKGMEQAVRAMAITKAITLTIEGFYHQYLAGVYTAASLAAVNPALALLNKQSAMAEQVASAGAFAGAGFFGSLGASLAAGELAGMAHSGITEIPEEGTWLLDKGERVVDASTNKDLKAFLGNGGNSTNIVVNINGGDEQGVLKALPQLKQVIIDVVNGDISQNGTIRQTIKNYT